MLDEEEDDFFTSFWDETADIKDREYGKVQPAPPLSVDDSAKFGSATPKYQ